MKITFNQILTVVAIVLVLVLLGGIVSSILPNFYLSTPTVKLKQCFVYDPDTGESVRVKKMPEDRVIGYAVFSISEVKGASRYDIYVNGELCMSTEKPEFDTEDIRIVGEPEYVVKVRAVREVSKGDPIVSDFSKVIYYSLQD